MKNVNDSGLFDERRPPPIQPIDIVQSPHHRKLLFHRVNLTYNTCRCTQLKIVVVMEYLPAGRQGYVQV